MVTFRLPFSRRQGDGHRRPTRDEMDTERARVLGQAMGDPRLAPHIVVNAGTERRGAGSQLRGLEPEELAHRETGEWRVES